MSQAAAPTPISTDTPRGMYWTGQVISGLVAAAMAMSAVLKFQASPQFVEQFGRLGWPVNLALVLGIVELSCAILYVIPPTSVLGAILFTGYLGGAIATHARLSDPMFFIPAVIGVLVWLGLFLRDARIRALIPLRR